MSYSGLGLKAGGPIGGKSQTSAYSVSCRWNAGSLIKKITKLRELFSRVDEVVVTNVDCQCVLNAELLYLDPPYYIKGNELYHHGFSQSDHENLAAALKARSAPWFLSYDDCEFVRDTYCSPATNYKVWVVPTTYTITSARKRQELLISNVN
jgi:DNA adenine methylase